MKGSSELEQSKKQINTMKKSLILSIILFNTSLIGSNIPQSLDGLIEVSYDGGSGTLVYLYNENICYGYMPMFRTREDFEQAVLTEDSGQYAWDNQTGVMSFGVSPDIYSYNYNFVNSPNPYIFPFTVEDDNNEMTNYGFFYDGRIDLDNNGVADEMQLASGNPYSFDRDVFNQDLLMNVLFASPGEFFSSLLPIESGSENIEHYTVKTLKSEDLENWDTVLTKTVKGTASNLFFKSEITPTE